MVSLDSLRLDLTGWSLHQRDESQGIWTDADGDVLAVKLFLDSPDLPSLAGGPDGIRDFFRQQCHAQGNGIVEVDVIEVLGIPCARMIMKARQQPTGFSFQGVLAIPRRDFSFVVRIQCLERGTTGLRECAVMMLELPKPEYEPPDPSAPKVKHPIFGEVIAAGKMKGWFKDPYDPKYDDIALRTLADAERYDAGMPTHPLSRARRKLRAMIDTVRLELDALEAPPFEIEMGRLQGRAS